METSLTHTRLHWREAGEGPTVVLLHGFPFSSAQWEPQLASPPDGWRLVAPDLRGFGASSASPGNEPYTMSGMAHDVARLLDELEIGRAVICGLSMGGYVAFAFWRAYRERTIGMVLCDTRATPDTDTARAGRVELAERVAREGAAAVRDAMLPKLLSPGTVRQRPDVVERVRAMMDVAPADALRHALLGMAERPDSEPLLRMIEVPTLVIVGEDDAITPPGEVALMARGIRGSQYEPIPDAGHLPNLERPELFDRVLHNFLQSAIRPLLARPSR
jgi:3-oxoadipate enol-lactonase